jgi:hypothetical protein
MPRRFRKRKLRLTGEHFGANNVSTAARAQMLALVHAMALAHQTIFSDSQRTRRFQRVVLLCTSTNVCSLVNKYKKKVRGGLGNIRHTADREMVGRVIAYMRRLSFRGLSVSLRHAVGQDTDAAKTARRLARQRGRISCRGRAKNQLGQKRLVDDLSRLTIRDPPQEQLNKIPDPF